MTLYNNLSHIYDIIFPENRSATEFLSKELKGKSRILDLACGTGNYSIALAGMGHDVIGIDLDEAMIEAARSKTVGENISFAAGDMLDIDALFSKRRFDLVFCIGNSLVHLPDRGSVELLAKKVNGLLAAEGMFIIQIVNYDRIVKYRIDSLPPVEKKEEGVKFIRNYEFTEDTEHIDFNTEIYGSGEKITNSVRLLALQSPDLMSILRSAGFVEIKLFGGYDESAHSDESMATIVKAVKV